MRPNLSDVEQQTGLHFIGECCVRMGWPADREEFTQAEAIALLDRHDLVISPGIVSELIRKGYVPAPPPTWTALHVLYVFAALFQRRRFKKTPCCYDVQKSHWQIALEQGQFPCDPLSAEVAADTTEDLLRKMRDANNAADRECIWTVLNARLAGSEE
jgi:hypothetical protein